MRSTQNTLRLYTGFQLFFSLLLWAPIFYEFQRRIGLSDPEIFGIQSIYYVAFCVLELPTGFLADWIGRRRCMRLGAAVLVLSNLLPIFIPTFQGLLWHWLLVALSRSFISGASSAYLYDYLKGAKAEALYAKVEGRARAYGLIAKVVAWAGVGMMLEWKLWLPYALTAVAAFIALAFAWALPEVLEQKQQERMGWVENLRHIRAGIAHSVTSPMLMFLMLQGVAIFVLTRLATVNLFQPILNAQGFEVGKHGLIMSAMTLFEALGSALPHVLRRYVSDLTAVFVLTVVMAVTLAWIAVGGPVVAVVGLCIFSWAAGITFPMQKQLVNQAIPGPEHRATLLSVESILDRGSSAGASWVLGIYLAAGELQPFLLHSASATVLIVVALVWALARLKLATPTLPPVQPAL